MDLPCGKPVSPRRLAVVLSFIYSPIACIVFWQYYANSFGLLVFPVTCLFLPFWLFRTANIYPRCWVLCWRLCSAWYIFLFLLSLPTLFIFFYAAFMLNGISLLPYIYLLFLTLLPQISLLSAAYLSFLGAHHEAQLVRTRLN
jgi:hypothetical protein